MTNQKSLVMKIIPLLTDRESLELDETRGTKEEKGENVDDEEEEDEEDGPEPTWSDPREVAKEVNLGKLVGGLDGFCNVRRYVSTGETETRRDEVTKPALFDRIVLLSSKGFTLRRWLKNGTISKRLSLGGARTLDHVRVSSLSFHSMCGH